MAGSMQAYFDTSLLRYKPSSMQTYFGPNKAACSSSSCRTRSITSCHWRVSPCRNSRMVGINRESLLATELSVEAAAGIHMLQSRFVELDRFRLVRSRWDCLPMLLTVHPGTF